MENLKQRHGCISAWLWLVIVANLCLGVGYFVTMFDNEGSQGVGYGLLSALCCSFILGAILLMRWSKCGFYLMVFTSFLTIAVNTYLLNIEIVNNVLGVLSLLLWWAILQIKKNGVSAWKLMHTTWDYKHCRHLYQVFSILMFVIVLISVIHTINSSEVKENDTIEKKEVLDVSEDNDIEWKQFVADNQSCKIEAPADFRKANLNEEQLFALVCSDYDPAFVAFSEPLKDLNDFGVNTSKQYAQVLVKNLSNAPGAGKFKKISEKELNNGAYVICYNLTVDGTAFRYNLVAIKSKTAYYYGLVYCIEKYVGKVEPVMSHMVNSFQLLK